MTEPVPPASLLAGCHGLVLGVSARESVGFHVAAGLRALGASVAVSHRAARRERATALAAELGCERVELDTADESSVERAFAEIGERFGRLDFLVHGIVQVPQGVLARPLLELSREEFGGVMEVGVRSLLVACRYALPWLARSRHPRVVSLSSAGSSFAIPSYHAVGIAKAALEASVRYLAQELGRQGVLCNALSFSILETAAADRVIGADRVRETRRYLEKRSMTGRPLDYEDVVRAVAFLASPSCSNVTAQTLTVDAGFSRSYF